MAKKIICESCGTIFPLDKVKDMSECPVCRASFDDEEEDMSESQEEVEEPGLLYFDLIDIFKDEPEYSHVSAYCNECKKMNPLDLDLFDKLVDKEYVI